jgi:putative tricarboxylic transport membrane protein
MDLFVIGGALLKLFDPQIIMWLLLGVFVGILFGAIPGLTATTAIALFTPMTFGMSFDAAFSFLMAIFCGGLYGGSIPAILIRTPGAPGNAATALDGYPLANKGRAGEALFLSVFSSWIGGTASALALIMFAPLIANLALKFGPQEYFSVSLFGLSCIAGLAGKSLAKGLFAGLFGMLLGTIGMDPIDGVARFTFNEINLLRGIAIVPALVGFFAITEVLAKTEGIGKKDNVSIPQVSINYANIKEYLKAYLTRKWLVFRSAAIGTIVGAIPGTGAATASWISYNEAQRSSKHPEEFGQGSLDGLIASETSNNAISGGAMIPLLTLGIPGDTATAVLLGALTIQGLVPGPLLLMENRAILPTILWMLLLGNVFMLLFGVLGSRFFPKILSVPQQILMPIILVLCVTGSYAVDNSYFDIKLAIALGVLSYFMMKYGFPLAPAVLGLILGVIIEPNFRRTLVANDMDPSIFVTSPISCLFLLLTAFTMYVVLKRRSKEKQAA